MGGDGTMTSGILRGIEDGWFTAEIADSAFVYQQALEKGDKKIVGVNCHTGTISQGAGDPARLARGRGGAAAGAGRAHGPRATAAAVDAALARMVDGARGPTRT